MKADEILPKDTTLRSSKHLNNLIEQDHRNVKSRVNTMPGFKSFRNAAVTISSIELKIAFAKLSSISRKCASKIPLRPPLGRQSFPLGEVAANTPFFRSPLKFAPEPYLI
jgi:hypothetical protein